MAASHFRIKPMGTALWTLLATMLVAHGLRAQTPPSNMGMPKVRQLTQKALEHFKKGEYDIADQFYQQAYPHRNQLTPNEQTDLEVQMRRNSEAYEGQQKARVNLMKADEAITAGKAAEADQLLRAAMSSPYLNTVDRQVLESIKSKHQQMQAGQAAVGGGSTDYVALLKMAREALKRGDLAAAEALANEASKHASSLKRFMTLDSPQRVIYDVGVERNRQRLAAEGKKEVPSAMEKIGNFITNPFAKSPRDPVAPTPNPAPMPYPNDSIHTTNKQGSNDPFKPIPPAMNPTPNPVANNTNLPAPAALPTDPNIALQQSRVLLQQERFDEAAAMAEHAQKLRDRWPLFSDSPSNVLKDVARSRERAQRERAKQHLAEARKALQRNNIVEAEAHALESQKLFNGYSAFDFGDRPQYVLQEVERLKRNQKTPLQPGNVPANDPVAQANRTRATALVSAARELERQGNLLEARTKALEARQLNVPFGPMDDTPESVLTSLNSKCAERIKYLIKQANDTVVMNPGDPNRFAKAALPLSEAKRLAQSFGLDTSPIDAKYQEIQQIAASGLQSMAGTVEPGNHVTNAHGTEPADPEARQRWLFGKELYQKACEELRAGATSSAYKLAMDAHASGYTKSLDLIRSIEAEEAWQRAHLANRNYQAGLDAFLQKNYTAAYTIFQALDIDRLHPDQRRRIGELMNTPEMRAQIQQVGALAGAGPEGTKLAPGAGLQGSEANNLRNVDLKEPAQASSKGKAVASDIHARASEVLQLAEIEFQKTRSVWIQKQNAAMELVKAGKEKAAIELLQEFQASLKSGGLDPDKMSALNSQVEAKIGQFKTIEAQKQIAAEQQKYGSSGYVHNEGKKQSEIRSKQEKLAKLVREFHDLYRQEKYDEAGKLVALMKAFAPEEAVVVMASTMLRNQINHKQWEQDKRDEAELWQQALRSGMKGPADIRNPLHLDKETLLKSQKRGDGKGIMAPLYRNPRERAIHQRLEQPGVPATWSNAPLHQVIKDLRDMSGIDIHPDLDALKSANPPISLDAPLSASFNSEISMKSMLEILLKQLKLTYTIQSESLFITTYEAAKGKTRQVVYPVTDLVVPVDNHPLNQVQDFYAAMNRVLNNGSNIMHTSPTPFSPPAGLPPGAPVSSSMSGSATNSSLFGSNNPGTSVGSGGGQWQKQVSQGTTIEQHLIDLITNTVAPNSWSSVGGQGTIQYFPLGMALVINQTLEVQEQVKDLLDALRKLQDLEVSIELKLMSVSEAFFERIGLDFDINIRTPRFQQENQLLTGNFAPFGFVNRNNQVNAPVIGMTPAGTLTPDLNIPLRNSSYDFSIPPFGGYPGTIGQAGGLSLGLAFLSDIQVFMFMEAAQGDRRTQIMQAPKITVFNGQTANINVTDNQFFLTGVSVAQAGSAIFFVPQNNPVPLGISFQVTPVVSGDRRFVRLNLTPTMTNLTNATVPLIPVQIPVPQLFDGPPGLTPAGGLQPAIFQMFFQQPSFQVISVNTTVNVPDGGTVLLGGLKTLAEARNEFGPPILSKIPYLNRLFKNVGYGREAQSLMIMVTPRIIINDEEERIFLGIDPPIPRP
jgi:Flp pilus assembly secretin CpaC